MFSLTACNSLQITHLIWKHVYKPEPELCRPPGNNSASVSPTEVVLTQFLWRQTTFKNSENPLVFFLLYWFTHFKCGHVNDYIYVKYFKRQKHKLYTVFKDQTLTMVPFIQSSYYRDFPTPEVYYRCNRKCNYQVLYVSGQRKPQGYVQIYFLTFKRFHFSSEKS